MKEEKIKQEPFDEPELERIYQECVRRGIFKKLRDIHKKRLKSR